MPKRIAIAEHLNISELEQLYKQAKDGIESRQYQIIDLQEVLFPRCQSLLQQQDLIQGLTGFHWWIKIGA